MSEEQDREAYYEELRQIDAEEQHRAEAEGAPAPSAPPPDDLLTLAKAIDSKVYAATPSVRVLARDYLRLRLAAEGLASLVAEMIAEMRAHRDSGAANYWADELESRLRAAQEPPPTSK